MDLDLTDELGPVSVSRRQGILALVIALFTVVLLAIIFSTPLSLAPLTPAEASFVEGQASPVNVLAPDRITYVSALKTKQAQAQAAAQVPDVYDPPDAEIARRQVRGAGRILDFLDTVRSDPYSTRTEKIDWLTSVPTVTVSAEVISRTLSLDSTAYQQVISETLYVLDQAMREPIRPEDLETVNSKLGSRVSLVLSADQADLVTAWAKSFVVPNSFYSSAKTEAARQAARDKVGVVYSTIEQGEAVVRAGEIVKPETYEALRELGFLQPQEDYQERITSVVFAFFLVVIGTLYLARFAPHLFRQWRVLLLLSFLLVGATLGAKIVVPGRSIIPYLFPFAGVGMLGAALLNAEVGIGMSVLVALAVGYVGRGTIDLITFTLLGGIIAVITLRHRDRLTAFVFSGAYVAAANVAVILVFHLGARGEDLANQTRLMLAALGGGVLTGLLALGSQFILGKLAGLTTALELIELARPTHPLLQKLLRDAPGTYNHSLIIGNLAEHAAQRIGADALLVRVGAYYHDVGKTLNPQYFVENQFDGVNIHDTLDPRASADILRQHVLDGLVLTRRYGVSNRVQEFVSQHHGTTISAFFYDKALRHANGASVNEDDFRYPGPKPQTREAVIMMLADGVEATTRAERPSSPEQIRHLIERIVDQRIQEGQLAEAPVSLRDLELIKQAFFDVLQGLYHPRIRYPQPAHLKSKAELAVQTADEKPDGH